MPRVHYKPMSDFELYLRRTRHYRNRHGLSTGKIDARLVGLKAGRLVN